MSLSLSTPLRSETSDLVGPSLPMHPQDPVLFLVIKAATTYSVPGPVLSSKCIVASLAPNHPAGWVLLSPSVSGEHINLESIIDRQLVTPRVGFTPCRSDSSA